MKKWLIENSYVIFFTGTLMSIGLASLGAYEIVFHITGLLIMLFSFYLMYLKSKKK